MNRDQRTSDQDIPKLKIPKLGEAMGWLSCIDTTNLNLPQKCFNGEYRLCKSEIRTNVKCQFGERCHNKHDHFHELSRDKQKAMVKLIDKKSKMEFVGINEGLLAEICEEIKKE